MTGTVPHGLVVMGVSGSGKSTVASLLARRLGWSYQDGDWFHPAANVEKMRSGTPLTDQDRKPWLQAIAAWLEENRRNDRHAIVACSALKRAYRDVLVGGQPDEVRIVYLKGEHELIADRMALRQGHYMPSSLLDSQFATLEPPEPGERPLTVGINAKPDVIVETIVSALEDAVGGPLPSDAVEARPYA